MFHTLAIAAAAAALIAAPACAQSIRVSTAGKSPEQLHADIVKAAQTVCSLADYDAISSRSSCVKATVKDAVAQATALKQVAMR